MLYRQDLPPDSGFFFKPKKSLSKKLTVCIPAWQGTGTFLFDNWYTSTDGGATLSDTAFDFNTAITKDFTLYAKWAEPVTLKDCSAIFKMFAALCDYSESDGKPASAQYYLDAAGNQIPLWYDEEKTTLFYYLEPGKKMSLRTSDDNNSLFSDMSKVVYIETGDFDTSNVTNMRGMFYGCKSLKALDLSSFDTSNVEDMREMFNGCSSLTTVLVSDKFVATNVLYSDDMFKDCTKLKGGAGTVYDENHIGKEYARIDGGTSNPGYFTAKK